MARKILVYDQSRDAVAAAATYVVNWSSAHPGDGLGVQASSPFDRMWNLIWRGFDSCQDTPVSFTRLVRQPVIFLDETFGAVARSHHWNTRHLHHGSRNPVLSGHFDPDRVWMPQGCFWYDGHVVTSARLSSILLNIPHQWSLCTEVGEDRQCPEIRIHADAVHPLLRDIRDQLDRFVRTVQQYPGRLQMVRLDLCGGFSPHRGARLGLVVCGAADPQAEAMLIYLPASIQDAIRRELHTIPHGGRAIEEVSHAVTLGVGGILSCGELLVAAWGVCRQALQQMCLGEPNALNPAAWVQQHNNVVVFTDRLTFAGLEPDALTRSGWKVDFRRKGS